MTWAWILPASLLLLVKIGLTLRLARLPWWTLGKEASQAPLGMRLCASWLLLEGLLVAWILILSSLHWLTPEAFISGVMVVTCLLLAWLPRTTAGVLCREPIPARTAWMSAAALLPVALAVIALFTRNCMLGDPTGDAVTYGNPRISLWLSQRSVLGTGFGGLISITVNEWLGELNCLGYALAGRDLLAAGLGGVEMLLVLAASVHGLARTCGLSSIRAGLLTSLLATAPAVYLLGVVTKGDLGAIAGGMVVMAGLVRGCKQPRDPAALLSIVLGGAFASACKVPCLAFWLPAMALLAHWWFRPSASGTAGIMAPRRLVALLVIVLAFAPVLLSRFLLNWSDFGGPLVRLPVEKAEFTWQNLSGNLELLWVRMMAPWQHWTLGLGSDALSSTLGGSGPLLCLIGTLGLLILLCRPSRNLLVPLAIFAVAATVACAALYVWPWNARYFLPSMLPPLVVLVAMACSGAGRGWLKLVAGLSATIALSVNAAVIAMPGDFMPHYGLVGAAQLDHTQRMMPRGLYLPRLSACDVLMSGALPQRTLVFNPAVTMASPYMLRPFEDRLALAGSSAELARTMIGSDHPTMIVAATYEHFMRNYDTIMVGPMDFMAAFRARGYDPIVANHLFTVGIPREAPGVQMLLSGIDATWGVYGAGPGITLSPSDAAVSSADLADACFVSPPVELRGAAVVRLRLAGDLIADPATSRDPDTDGERQALRAGHVSLHGERLLISLPEGHIPQDRWWATTFVPPRPGAYRFSVGLGGWTKGRGSLHIRQFEVLGLVDSRYAVPWPTR